MEKNSSRSELVTVTVMPCGGQFRCRPTGQQRSCCDDPLNPPSIPELEGEFIDLTPEQRAGPQEAPPDPKLGNASGVPEAPEKPAPPRKTHWMVAAGLPPFDPVHSYTLDELRTLAATYCGLHPTQGKPMGGETARRSYSRAGLWPRIHQGLWPRQKGRGGRLPD